MQNFHPTGDKILIRTEKTPEQVGEIVVPENQRKENIVGTAVAVGPDNLDVRIGDRVLYCPFNGYQIDEQHRLILGTDAIGVVDE